MEARAVSQPRGSWRALPVAVMAAVALLTLASAPAAAFPGPWTNLTGTSIPNGQANNSLQGIMVYPEAAMIANLIKSDPKFRTFLAEPGRMITGFAPLDTATKALIRSVGRWGGAALQNDTFMQAVFDYMLVPGKTLTTEELRAAAPVTLKTRAGEPLEVTPDPNAPYGIRVAGCQVVLGDRVTRDGKSTLHILDGAPMPPSQDAIRAFWEANAVSPDSPAAAGAAAAAANEAGQKAKEAGVAAAATSGAGGASRGFGGAVGGAAAVAALLALLL